MSQFPSNSRMSRSKLQKQQAAQVQLHSDTLQQQISTTVMRDVKNILVKLKYVIIPRFKIEHDSQATKQLRNWDLWGPLVLCLLLSFILNIGIEGKGKSFGIIFLIMWGGALIVTINTKLLGGHISYCQCICVLGYCILPIVLAAAGVYLLKQVHMNIFLIKLGIAAVALIWSTLSSISFMNVLIQEQKKIVAIYPIFIFYLFIDWFILFI